MTRSSVEDEQYGQLWRRLEEVARRVDEGTIPFESTMKSLQAIVEDKLTQDTGNSYPVTVDYSMSLADMITAGRYDWANEDITFKNFPINGKGQAEIMIEIIHFNRCIQSEGALNDFENTGLRAAALPELLAFGAKYPDMQREFPIIALGSLWQDSYGSRRVPALWSSFGGRGLGLDWFRHRWIKYFRFAAVRK